MVGVTPFECAIKGVFWGRAVKLLKKEKDFALVLWTDDASGAEIQGLAFARYLGKFK
jgi:hypothetical protein